MGPECSSDILSLTWSLEREIKKYQLFTTQVENILHHDLDIKESLELGFIFLLLRLFTYFLERGFFELRSLLYKVWVKKTLGLHHPNMTYNPIKLNTAPDFLMCKSVKTDNMKK